MVRVETIQRRVSEIILTPFNDINTLKSSCLTSSPLLPDSSLRMCQGINATALNGGHFINGQYGIKKFDEFSLGSVRNRLGRSNFRIEMMQAMIEIAKKLGLKGIVGFPVRPYSMGDVRTYLHKTAGRDGMFELFNFSLRNEDQPNEAYYYLSLES